MQVGLKNIVPRPVTNQYHHLQSRLASHYYGHPQQKLKIIGVTGTDGKTTTVNLLYHILRTAGFKAGLISTVKTVIGNKDYDTGLHVTTPSPLQIKSYLAKMVRDGADYAVLEITSHALDQNRESDIEYDYAVVTNISHEHLDYHGSFENYVKAKAKLVKKAKVAILNRDDPNFDYLKEVSAGLVISFGIRNKADYMATEINLAPFGTRFTLRGERWVIRTPLIGTFNIYNCLAAMAVAREVGVDKETILKSLRTFPSLPGRMERVERGQNFTVIVDFAHTPQALEEALKTLRLLTRKRLIAVFGSAGQRDIEKRAMMGKIAIRGADLIVLTSEDPRSEDPNQIMTEIATGVVKNGGVLNKNFWMIQDRGKGVEFAINHLAKTSDVVAIFGKGHEKSMSVKGKEIPWSDQEEVIKSLRGRKKG